MHQKQKSGEYKELGLNSETAAMFNITSREQVILNTWYGGEMKKRYVLYDELLSSAERASLPCTVPQTQT